MKFRKHTSHFILANHEYCINLICSIKLESDYRLETWLACVPWAWVNRIVRRSIDDWVVIWPSSQLECSRELWREEVRCSFSQSVLSWLWYDSGVLSDIDALVSPDGEQVIPIYCCIIPPKSQDVTCKRSLALVPACVCDVFCTCRILSLLTLISKGNSGWVDSSWADNIVVSISNEDSPDCCLGFESVLKVCVTSVWTTRQSVKLPRVYEWFTEVLSTRHRRKPSEIACCSVQERGRFSDCQWSV